MRIATVAPSTVIVAARPRDIPVFAITSRTGYSKTSARKMPTKMIRNVEPIAMNAAIRPMAAATIRHGPNRQQQLDPPWLARLHRVESTQSGGR